MKQVILLTGIFLLSCGCYDLSHAAAAVRVQVAVGKVTEVVFPQKIAKVIKGGRPDSVLIEVLDHSIYLLPKTDSPADVFVTLASGESYPLDLNISLEHDARIEVNGSLVDRVPGSGGANVMALMKEVLLGRQPAGATVLKGGQELSLNISGIKLLVEAIYDFPNIAAYKLKALNLSSNSVVIPLQQVTFPNLLAIASEQDILFAKGQDGDTASIFMIVGK